MSESLDASKNGLFSRAELLSGVDVTKLDLDDEIRKELASVQDSEIRYKERMFTMADKDRDGELSSDELVVFYDPATYNQVLAQEAIQEKDNNSDGLLSMTEFFYSLARGPRLQEEDISYTQSADFKALDSDGSGALDESEVAVWESGWHHSKLELELLFKSADSNGDGRMTQHEFVAFGASTSDNAPSRLHEWAAHEEL